jgi:hypothetical protein
LDYDTLSITTIRGVGGMDLIAHVVVEYLITGIVMFFVYVNWVQSVRPVVLRGLRMIFESTQVPYPTTVVHIERKVGKLPELIEYHNTTLRVLGQVVVRYLKG